MLSPNLLTFASVQENLWDEHNTDEGYTPKQSRRVKLKSTTPADGDTWTEHKVILPERLRVERQATNSRKVRKKRYRSYFKSKLTDRTVWDEPPSGASYIILFHERQVRCEI